MWLIMCCLLTFASGTWSPLDVVGELPTPRKNAGLVEVNGTLYMYGGDSAGIVMNDAWKLSKNDNATTYSWVQLDGGANVSLPHISHPCMIARNNSIFVAGEGKAVKIDVETSTLQRLVVGGFSPQAVRGQTCANVGVLHFFGGEDSAGEPLDEFYFFNTTSLRFVEAESRGGPAPGARTGHTMGGRFTTVFIYGGTLDTFLYHYRIADRTWSIGRPMISFVPGGVSLPARFTEGSTAVLLGGKLVVGFGTASFSSGQFELNSVMIVCDDPTMSGTTEHTITCLEIYETPDHRIPPLRKHASGAMFHGELVVFGGEDSMTSEEGSQIGHYKNDMWTYSLATVFCTPPCWNGGVCTAGIDGKPFCECNGTGYHGSTCIDPNDGTFPYAVAGCFKASNNLRDVGPIYETMTRGQRGATSPQFCSYWCEGYPFFGLFNLAECYCTHEDYTVYGEATNCNLPCWGDPNEMCGGANAMLVYTTGAPLPVRPQLPPPADPPTYPKQTGPGVLTIVLATFGVLTGLCAVSVGALAHRKMRRGEMRLHHEIPFKEIDMGPIIGRGSFGEVYKATFRGTDVAVKMLRHDKDHKNIAKSSLGDFFREVDMMCDLRHPNVVLFMGACTKKEVAMVTELMHRGSVFDLLQDQDVLIGPMRMATILSDTSRGMNFLHKSDPCILHHDLKSLNLLVDNNWITKVADFGLTIKAGKKQKKAVVGSVLWASPEVLRKEPYTKSCDVYAFGVVAFEVVTRSLPYEGVDLMTAARQVMRGTLRPKLPDDIPEDLKALIESCWSHDVTSRPDFEKICVDLSTIVATERRYFAEEPSALAPSGYVFFVVTNVMDVNKLWNDIPHTMKGALRVHNRIVRNVMKVTEGYQVGCSGFGALLVFGSSSAALRFCYTVNLRLMSAKWPDDLLAHTSASIETDRNGQEVFRGLRLCMLVHSGPVTSHTDQFSGKTSYSGDAVKKTLALASIPAGGQMLVTSTVEASAEEWVATIPALSLISLGPAAVGEYEEACFYQLSYSSLKRTFPPLNAASTTLDKLQVKTAPTMGPSGRTLSQASESAPLIARSRSDRVLHLTSSLVSLADDNVEVTLGAVLGQGTYGCTFEGFLHGERVAIKEVYRRKLQEDLSLDFMADFICMKNLVHANIVQLKSAMISPVVRLIFEYVDPPLTLEMYLAEETLAEKDAAMIMRDVALGLEFLHDQHPVIVHASLNERNVMIHQAPRRAKLTDYGFGWLKHATRTHTAIGDVHICPEVLNGAAYTVKSDIYFYGMVAYFTLTGRKVNASSINPSEGSSELVMPTWCNDDLSKLVSLCWRDKPYERPTARDVLHVIVDIIDTLRYPTGGPESAERRPTNLPLLIMNKDPPRKIGGKKALPPIGHSRVAASPEEISSAPEPAWYTGS